MQSKFGLCRDKNANNSEYVAILSLSETLFLCVQNEVTIQLQKSGLEVANQSQTRGYCGKFCMQSAHCYQ